MPSDDRLAELLDAWQSAFDGGRRLPLSQSGTHGVDCALTVLGKD